MKRFATTADNTPGKGVLVCHCYHDLSKFERIHAQYPLKFIPTTGHADRLAVVYMLSYGGGVISGDQFEIDIQVKKNAILLLMTQGNTKIFKDRLHQQQWLASLQDQRPTFQFTHTVDRVLPSVQTIQSVVQPDATLLVLPDPVTCFRDSSFESRQEFKLEDASAQLVLLDWFTSGRMTRGENWSFRHYSSRIDVRIGSRLVIRDAMVLDDEDYMRQNPHETAYAHRLKPYSCFATLIIIAAETDTHAVSPLKLSVDYLQAKTEKMRLMPLSLKSKEDRQVLWSVSPMLKGRGALVRVAGMTTEQVRDFVKYECLGQGLEKMIGEGMFKKILM
ncbi:urease accessory protein UreD [Blakeslea trispora]|nr:urease accessory protein UreD [Blakeslea trispora]